MDTNIEENAANPAVWPLAAAALIIAIPLFEIGPDSPLFSFAYWGGGNDFNRMEVIRNFALIVGGFLGLWLAWRRIVLMDQQTEVALQDSKQKEMDHVAARFERAVELLGSDELRFQQFAVSRIFNIAVEWPDEYLEVAVNLIAGQLRITAAKNRKKRDPEGFQTAAVNEMAMCLFGLIHRCWNEDIYFGALELQGVCLEDVIIKGIEVRPETFKDSEFCHAEFYDCSFVGHFEPDSLNCGMATFTNCDFTGADFIDCDLSQASFFDCEAGTLTWVGCDLRSAGFRGVVWRRGGVAFFRCLMDRVDFDPESRSFEATTGAATGSPAFEECCVRNAEHLPTGLGDFKPAMDIALTGEQDERGHRFDVVVQVDDDHPLGVLNPVYQELIAGRKE